MSVDWEVIDHATFWSDAEDIEELNLSNKNIENLGVCLPALSNLRVLNLAFNRLASLHALQKLESIQALNVSHNSLDSVNPLSALEGLETLKLSFNNVKNLQPLAFCNRLKELHADHNRIDSFKSLHCLGRLTSLVDVVLRHNPATAIASVSHYREQVAEALPHAKVLDGMPLVARCGRRRSTNSGTYPGRPSRYVLKKSHSLGSTRSGPESVDPSVRSSFDGASTTSLTSAVSSKAPSVRSRSTKFTNLNKLPARCIEKSRTATFQDVVDRLSSIQLTAGPPPKQPRRLQKPKPVVSRSDSHEKEIVYRQKYTGSLASSQNLSAVTIRRDGSAEVKWPNGQIAVSVEVVVSQGVPQYHMFATHRGSSQLAASFRPNGNGFVQDSDGKMLLQVLKEGKKGQVYRKGDAVSSWDHYEGTQMSVDSTTVDMPLSKEMGIRYCIVSKHLEVYFLCENVRQMVVLGSNGSQDQWPDTDSANCPPFVHDMIEPKQQKKVQPTMEASIEMDSGVTIDSLNSALIHLTSNIKRLLAEPI